MRYSESITQVLKLSKLLVVMISSTVHQTQEQKVKPEKFHDTLNSYSRRKKNETSIRFKLLLTKWNLVFLFAELK